MKMTIEEMTHEASLLPREARIRLASHLIALDEPEPSADVEAAWEAEIVARMERLDQGQVAGVPWDEVLARVDQDHLS
jgi:putative addiction module component (TIGR02574 family)